MVAKILRALTTKDTKVHEGNRNRKALCGLALFVTNWFAESGADLGGYIFTQRWPDIVRHAEEHFNDLGIELAA